MNASARNADKKARALYAANAFPLRIEQARARFTSPEAQAAFDAAIFDERRKRYGTAGRAAQAA